ncbi:hypothetical protein ABZ951_31405 [Streptomyces sp. NPDC046215]
MTSDDATIRVPDQGRLPTEPKNDSYDSCEEYKYGDTIAFQLRVGSSIEIPTHTFKRRD